MLVVGWKNWGLAEYGAVAGGPLMWPFHSRLAEVWSDISHSIYTVRLALLTYYNYRTSKFQFRLDELEKERNATIEKLKTATKYNSTQELLKKYGGTPSPEGKAVGSPKQGNTGTPKSGRINVLPPPTANIPGRNMPASLPSTPQRSTPEVKSPLGQIVPHSAAAATPKWERPPSSQDASAEFAPNAFPSAPQYSQPGEGPRWYDRIVDALLGEDETLPKNRMALICSQCRLVNGQAPPGVKRLEDVGKWRCGGCGAKNGEESEAKKIISTIQEQAASAEDKRLSNKSMSSRATGQKKDEVPANQAAAGYGSDITQYTDSSEDEEVPSEKDEPPPKPVVEPEPPRRRSTRPKRGAKEI